MVEHESRLAADVTGQRRAHRRDRPGRDVTGGRVERLVGRDPFDTLVDVVDLAASPAASWCSTGPQPKVKTPGVAANAVNSGACRTQYFVHRGLVRVGGVIEHLRHPHRFDTRDTPVSTSGKTSLANPESIPVVKKNHRRPVPPAAANR